MKIEIVEDKVPKMHLTLVGDEIKYMRMALERATFVDTPPQHQRAIYNFAEELLRRLEHVGTTA